MKAIRCNLAKTRTHGCRYCIWQQVQAGLGVLEVHEGRTPDRVRMTGRYLLREHEPTYCRRISVTKQSVDGGDVYWISLGDEAVCDCTGFTAHGHCKHVDSIRAIINSGNYVPRSTDPVQSFYSEQEYDDPT